MRQSVSCAGRSWHTERSWSAIGPDAIAVERSQQHNGSFHVSTELPTLDEYAAADIHEVQAWPKGEVITRLSNRRTGGRVRERALTVSHPLVTLGSLPLFVANRWEELIRGESLCASYIVLKVQRAATVDLTWLPEHPLGAHVAVTPRNWLLRAIFGSTRLFTLGDLPIFLRQEGLLDPRDLRANGRWKEYLGVLEFEHPWDLTSLCNKEAAHELA